MLTDNADLRFSLLLAGLANALRRGNYRLASKYQETAIAFASVA